MKIFRRRSLPESVRYNGKDYKCDFAASAKCFKPRDAPEGSVIVACLSRRHEETLDLHNKPYQHSLFVFTKRDLSDEN